MKITDTVATNALGDATIEHNLGRRPEVVELHVLGRSGFAVPGEHDARFVHMRVFDEHGLAMAGQAVRVSCAVR